MQNSHGFSLFGFAAGQLPLCIANFNLKLRRPGSKTTINHLPSSHQSNEHYFFSRNSNDSNNEKALTILLPFLSQSIHFGNVFWFPTNYLDEISIDFSEFKQFFEFSIVVKQKNFPIFKTEFWIFKKSSTKSEFVAKKGCWKCKNRAKIIKIRIQW